MDIYIYIDCHTLTKIQGLHKDFFLLMFWFNPQTGLGMYSFIPIQYSH